MLHQKIKKIFYKIWMCALWTSWKYIILLDFLASTTYLIHSMYFNQTYFYIWGAKIFEFKRSFFCFFLQTTITFLVNQLFL